jgi:hypothetical protein
MRSSFALLLLITAVPGCEASQRTPTAVQEALRPQPQPQRPSGIEYPTPDAALAALRVKPGVTVREENDWYVFHDSSENTFWSITQPANPAHPSAVKRTLYEEGGSVRMKTSILCGASVEICDSLNRSFQEADASLRQ